MILVARVRRPPSYRSRLCTPLYVFQVFRLWDDFGSFDSDEHNVSQVIAMTHNSAVARQGGWRRRMKEALGS